MFKVFPVFYSIQNITDDLLMSHTGNRSDTPPLFCIR